MAPEDKQNETKLTMLGALELYSEDLYRVPWRGRHVFWVPEEDKCI